MKISNEKTSVPLRLTYFLLCLLLASCLESPTNLQEDPKPEPFQKSSRLDILWVIDNSSSMLYRRDYVKDHMNSFISTLTENSEVDFQMAVVTTDYLSDKANLVQSNDGLEVVRSSELSDPAKAFAAIVENVQDTPTSFWEQGLESAYQAIEKHGKNFVREEVPLAIIFVTDENDYSCREECVGVEPDNNNDWIAFSIHRYFEYFGNLKKGENTEVHIFPIVGLPESSCSLASMGLKYIEVQRQLSEHNVNNLGMSLSICDEDIQTSYQKVAEILSEL